MGAWGAGLLDNDGALDGLGDLFDGLRPRTDAQLPVVIGLQAWLQGHVADGTVEALRAREAWLVTLPKAVREPLELLLRDHGAFVARHSRPPEVIEVLGTYCDGPRYDALLSVPGAEAVIAELAASTVERLDDLLVSSPDLYEASDAGGYLGVLVELSVAGHWSAPRGAVNEWRRHFDRVDAETTGEREFWDDYVAHVHGALKLLNPR